MNDTQDTTGAARQPQLAYSELQTEMQNEEGRRQKARKIVLVTQHFLGRDDLAGVRALDIGCSTGFTAEELSLAGADVTGIDIDEPGLAAATARVGDHISFVRAAGDDIPFPDHSFDLVILNHIYEHVVDPDAIMSEIRRVLRPDGIVYMGLVNKFGVMEPHYHLPFLSWIPKRLAHRYIRATGRADSYYETFKTRAGLLRMCKGLTVWDYTYTVLTDSRRFGAEDVVPGPLASLPGAAWRLITPVIPTFVWVGTPGTRRPAGPLTTVEPSRASHA
ncbi:class I SAM-dependent methyltransferase [Lapillicoccus sp.]|uniref:class I SAM-dependent methyltransferase n=1 Tax=Lapillicoccus sp. TaxID=1909287 RepID=UPI00260097D0|nr:class I SAM-dependent methyltransferase [Lapillicoccus sp.]